MTLFEDALGATCRSGAAHTRSGTREFRTSGPSGCRVRERAGADMQLGLGALRVIDLSSGIPGGYCARLLADAGADVVKVEPPGGDPLRAWSIAGCDRPTAIDPIEDALFRFLHHGMRSVVGDADDAEVRELIAGADVLIDGTTATQFDLDALRAEHPGLVVCSITPYGRTGPYADRPATEFIVQAESGGLMRRGKPEGVPFQAGGRASEWIAGTFASVAVASAARRAQQTGHGEQIDLSICEVMTIAANSYGEYMRSMLGNPPITGPSRSIETPSIEPTLDGYVGFCTNSREQFDNFLVLIERSDLIGEATFARLPDRLRRWDEWNEIVHAWTPGHTTADVVKRASELRIPVAPVLNGETIFDCDHFVARRVFVGDPTATFRHPRRPWRIDDEDPPAPTASPRLGEHTGKVESAHRLTAGADRCAAAPSCGRPRPRPDRVVGGPDRCRSARGAGCRRDPCRVDLAHRRHAEHRREHGHGRPVVGTVHALPVREHEQACI